MRISLSVLLVALIVTGGCASGPAAPATCGPQPTEDQINKDVKAYIAGTNWKDPDSVVVRNIHMHQCRSIWNGLMGGGHVVGWEIDFEVNAKNSYGGYTGFETRSIIRTADGRALY
jgi:hypothetical protein